MAENELHELNRFPENCERKQVETARGMTKKAWFMSLVFPVLSILESMIWVLICLSNSWFPNGLCAAILSLAVGGIVPYVLIVRNSLDLSGYFPVKIILFSVLAVGATLTVIVPFYWIIKLFTLPVFPMLIIAAEIVYAARQKTDRKTKICLTLSSLAWGWLGLCLELVIAFVFF